MGLVVVLRLRLVRPTMLRYRLQTEPVELFASPGVLIHSEELVEEQDVSGNRLGVEGDSVCHVCLGRKHRHLVEEVAAIVRRVWNRAAHELAQLEISFARLHQLGGERLWRNNNAVRHRRNRFAHGCENNAQSLLEHPRHQGTHVFDRDHLGRRLHELVDGAADMQRWRCHNVLTIATGPHRCDYRPCQTD